MKSILLILRVTGSGYVGDTTFLRIFHISSHVANLSRSC